MSFFCSKFLMTMHLNSRESPYCGLYSPTRSASPPSFHFSGLFFFSSHQFPQTPWSTHWCLKTPGKFPLGSFAFTFASLKNIQPHTISLPCLPTYICAHISASLPVTMDMLFLLISQIPISNGSYTFLLTQGQLSSNCPSHPELPILSFSTESFKPTYKHALHYLIFKYTYFFLYIS